METGFVIVCLRCGSQHKVLPGRRNYRSETITFGTDNYGADHITCECGNAIEEWSAFDDKPSNGEFIVEWRDISK